MSYDLGIFYTSLPMTAEKASQQYVALCGRPLDTPDVLQLLIEPSRHVEAFAAEMMSLYPALSSLSDDTVDLSPWSCDPDISEGHVIVSVVWSQSRQMAKTLTEMAWRHGLVVYSPQDGKVYPPPTAPQTPPTPHSWWRFGRR